MLFTISKLKIVPVIVYFGVISIVYTGNKQTWMCNINYKYMCVRWG